MHLILNDRHNVMYGAIFILTILVTSSSSDASDVPLSQSRSQSQLLKSLSCDSISVHHLIDQSSIILKAFGGLSINDTHHHQMILSPIIVYKGAPLLRSVAHFTSSQRFNITGQFSASLHPLRCYDNDVMDALPTQLIVFGTLDAHGRFLIQINGLHQWTDTVESYVWHEMGWSDWSAFTACSVRCGKGVQQRFRHCRFIDDKAKTFSNTNSFAIASNIHQKYKQHSRRLETGVQKSDIPLFAQSSSAFCEGFNLEQRNCNMFKCNGAVDLLSPLKTQHSTTQAFGMKVVQNFTIFLIYRPKNEWPAHIFSIENDQLPISRISMDQTITGLRLLHEKYNLNEMLPIKYQYDAKNNDWRRIAISIKNGDCVSIYVNCVWNTSFILSKTVMEIEQNFHVSIGEKFNGEIEQLTVTAGLNEKLQCSPERTPIVEEKQYLIENIVSNR